MKYPKEYLDEIKLRIKVSDVVSKSVQLKKRGKEFIGLSPFKNEKSPSFTVSDEKEFYHCFSTGEHGNIFDFIMKTKSIGFGEAVKTLAAEAGMPVYRFSKLDEKREKKFQTYIKIFKDYLNFFHQELISKNNEALNYLKRRELKNEIINEFKLGYVSWQNDFYNKLLKSYSEEEINSTGLYYKSDKTGKYIDRFNSRIIFPINNLNGDTIALGGRIIKESKMAKYINSPETEFYKKGKVIFNLDKAKLFRGESKEVVVVEGYMDVISLYSSGVKNVVSNSGTTLTEMQIQLIWKFFSNPIICLDGDVSGQNAALRIAERLFYLINENNKIYFSILPNGSDPDDFIKKEGKENFLKFLNTKTIIQSFIWNAYLKEVKKEDPFTISKFEKKIKILCYTLKDETLKKYILEEFLGKIRNLTPIQNSRYNINNKYKKNNKYRQQDFKILNETKNLHRQKGHFTKEQLTEFSILFILLNHSHVAAKKIEELSELKFSNKNQNELKDSILSSMSDGSHKKKGDFAIFMKKYENLIHEIEKGSNLKNIMSKKEDNDISLLLNDLLDELKTMNHMKKIEYLEAEVAKNLDENSYSELIKLKNQLNRD